MRELIREARELVYTVPCGDRYTECSPKLTKLFRERIEATLQTTEAGGGVMIGLTQKERDREMDRLADRLEPKYTREIECVNCGWVGWAYQLNSKRCPGCDIEAGGE